MESVVPDKRTAGLTVVALLALVQCIAGVLRALKWFEIGSDLLGQGVLLLPMIGLVAIGRGMLVAVLGSLFLVFACGALLQRHWSRWLGISLAIVNLLLVLGVLVHGDSPARALVWAIAPVAMLGYLFSSPARQALKVNANI